MFGSAAAVFALDAGGVLLVGGRAPSDTASFGGAGAFGRATSPRMIPCLCLSGALACTAGGSAVAVATTVANNDAVHFARTREVTTV
ncbi:hypothetical protein GCM10010185_60330 [Saccharothrix coeruleofusca]|uniref:Uncharacterized protein n=1 Tax=Saccharothrix coeruleofusca TaxID=33919 RepID=A0A918ASQ7_9PSEU|nr:hypothetical protein GCM10010185_60330 [Saccharothrix coeruleofusca]